MSNSPQPTFSFVLPVHNEAGNLDELELRLRKVMDELGEYCEAILVDDGSHDQSLEMMREIRTRDERFKVVALSRNFGHQAAITAGLDLAQGRAVIVMDSDLQHPPEAVPLMVSSWREGFEVVNAVRVDRHSDRAFKRISARAFYWLLGRLSDTRVASNVGDFRLVDRRALDAFKSMRESTRYLRGMFSWVGFRQTKVPYECQGRHAGTPTYNFARMLRLAIDGIASFSTAPLELALHIGFVVAALSFIAGVGDLITKLTDPNTVPGWLSIVITVSFLGGMQLVILGVMGTYMGRMYEEVKARPLYIVQELDGIAMPATRIRGAHLMSADTVSNATGGTA